MDINRYNLEFILAARDTSADEISDSLVEFADEIEVSPYSDGEFKVCARAEDPTLIFDACAQFGRIKSIKINEGGGNHG